MSGVGGADGKTGATGAAGMIDGGDSAGLGSGGAGEFEGSAGSCAKQRAAHRTSAQQIKRSRFIPDEFTNKPAKI